VTENGNLMPADPLNAVLRVRRKSLDRLKAVAPAALTALVGIAVDPRTSVTQRAHVLRFLKSHGLELRRFPGSATDAEADPDAPTVLVFPPPAVPADQPSAPPVDTTSTPVDASSEAAKETRPPWLKHMRIFEIRNVA